MFFSLIILFIHYPPTRLQICYIFMTYNFQFELIHLNFIITLYINSSHDMFAMISKFRLKIRRKVDNSANLLLKINQAYYNHLNENNIQRAWFEKKTMSCAYYSLIDLRIYITTIIFRNYRDNCEKRCCSGSYKQCKTLLKDHVGRFKII